MNSPPHTGSPQFETPGSRLAELVQLLADVSLSEALEELPASVDRDGRHTDPLWVVAGALVRLRKSAARNTHAGLALPV